MLAMILCVDHVSTFHTTFTLSVVLNYRELLLPSVPMNYSYLSENALLPTLISVTSGSLCGKSGLSVLKVLTTILSMYR